MEVNWGCFGEVSTVEFLMGSLLAVTVDATWDGPLLIQHRTAHYMYILLCLKSKCTDFLFNYLLDLPEITSYLLRSMTLGKIHSGSNVSSTDHSSTGSHFP